MDPRVPLVVERLLKHHAPTKNLSDLSEETRKMAESEAKILLEVIDELRPPDLTVLATRQVEKISAWAKQQQLLEAIEILKKENLVSSGRHEHLKTGLQWAVDVLRSRLASSQEI